MFQPQRRARLLAAPLLLACWTACGDDSADDELDGGADAGAGAGEPDAMIDCATDDLTYAPPPTEVAGLLAVPMDVHAVEASIVFDAEAQTASATATLRFALGNDAGNPVFDLRQGIERVVLDGEELTEDDIWHQDLGGGVRAQMRVIKPRLAACSEHTLELEYTVREPGAPGATGPLWEADGLYWNLNLRDVMEARYLEQWLPANLIHDRYPVTLDLELIGTDVEHLAISNGEVEDVAAGRWHVAFPADFTALSHMLLIRPASAVEHLSALDSETSIQLEVYRENTILTPTDELLTAVTDTLREKVASEGAYQHGDRYVVLFWSEQRGIWSMEYDGATTTRPSALGHETLHMWYGRGTKPATANDGWFDEAITQYLDDPPTTGLTLDDDPVLLSPPSPWSRHSPTEAYSVGASIFVTLEAAWGQEVLLERARAFFAEHADSLITTAQLETYLYCASNDELVRQLFHRFVYGQEGEPAPADPAACP